MLIRTISGAIGLAVLAALLLLPAYVAAFTVLVASIIGLYEFSRAVAKRCTC